MGTLAPDGSERVKLSLNRVKAIVPHGLAQALGSRALPPQLALTPISLLVIQGLHSLDSEPSMELPSNCTLLLDCTYLLLFCLKPCNRYMKQTGASILSPIFKETVQFWPTEHGRPSVPAYSTLASVTPDMAMTMQTPTETKMMVAMAKHSMTTMCEFLWMSLLDSIRARTLFLGRSGASSSSSCRQDDIGYIFNRS